MPGDDQVQGTAQSNSNQDDRVQGGCELGVWGGVEEEITHN